MNFYFSTTKITNLSPDFTEYKIDKKYYLYLDQEWIQDKNFFYKGTSFSWCKIYLKPKIKIETNKYRDFSIFYNDVSFSNFIKLENDLPVDGVLEFDEKTHIHYDHDFYSKIKNYASHDIPILNFKECHTILFDSLIENVKKFLDENSKPVLMPAQGGSDSLVVRSVFDYLKAEYSLFDLPQKPPKRSLHGNFLSKRFWGFSQIQENKSYVVATGFYGDEWILRNPFYVHILLSKRNVDIIREFDNKKNVYMKDYFEHYRAKCRKKTELSTYDLITQICNDFQIWHLNKTFFFSPLKHENLFKLFGADTDTIVGQVTDIKLSKSIIERCNPKLLNLIDSRKNQNDPYYFL